MRVGLYLWIPSQREDKLKWINTYKFIYKNHKYIFNYLSISRRKIHILWNNSSNTEISLSGFFELQVTINPLQTGLWRRRRYWFKYWGTQRGMPLGKVDLIAQAMASEFFLLVLGSACLWIMSFLRQSLSYNGNIVASSFKSLVYAFRNFYRALASLLWWLWKIDSGSSLDWLWYYHVPFLEPLTLARGMPCP